MDALVSAQFKQLSKISTSPPNIFHIHQSNPGTIKVNGYISIVNPTLIDNESIKSLFIPECTHLTFPSLEDLLGSSLSNISFL